MNLKSLSRGFTLIELLVVITIIGILSGVVLTSLSASRAKARDARIKAEMKNMRTVLELGFNGSNGTYPDLRSGSEGTNVVGYIFGIYNTNSVCSNFGSSKENCQSLVIINKDISKQGGKVTYVINNKDTGIYNRAKSFALYSSYASNPNLYFCIDSTGKVNPKATAKNTSVCPD